jgi:hypothetical protein
MDQNAKRKIQAMSNGSGGWVFVKMTMPEIADGESETIFRTQQQELRRASRGGIAAAPLSQNTDYQTWKTRQTFALH